MSSISQPSLESQEKSEKKTLNVFSKYLAIWIIICMAIGILMSVYIPGLSAAIEGIKIGNVSVPIGICLFFMIYPALLNLKGSELKKVITKPKPVFLTLFISWIISPLLRLALSNLMLRGQDQLITAVLLGAAPCTAMVLVWGWLAKANQEQNFITTSLNTILIIILYAPLVSFLTGVQNIKLDYLSLVITVAVFIGVPLVLGVLSRSILVPRKGIEWFDGIFRKKMEKVSMIALLVTLLVIFALNGQNIINHPVELLLISATLLILYPTIVLIGLGITRLFHLKYRDAAIVVIIGSSSHFEIAIATAIGLFTASSQAALGTTMGLFWEVPTMLSLVFLLKWLKSRNFWKEELPK